MRLQRHIKTAVSFSLGAGLLVVIMLSGGCLFHGNRAEPASKDAYSKGPEQINRLQASSSSEVCRGSILDRTGAILVMSRKKVSVGAWPSALPSGDDWVSNVSSLIGLEPDAVKEILASAENFVWLKTDVPEDAGRRLEQMHYNGIKVYSRFSRTYPYGALASAVIGFVGPDGSGLDGVEYVYESKLGRGGSGDSAGRGSDLKLTIERGLQMSAERELDLQLSRLKAAKGCLLVMDVQTGELLAVANRPSWRPDRFWERDSSLITSCVVQDSLDPAVLIPVLKFVRNERARLESIALAEHEDGLNTVRNDISGDRSGSVPRKQDSTWESPADGMVFWSPVSETDDTGAVDGSILLNDLWSLGFGQMTGLDLPDESSGNLPPHIGSLFRDPRGMRATPIQTLRAFSAIINGGRMIRPHVADDIDSDSPFSSKIRTVGSLSGLPEVREEVSRRVRKRLAVRRGPSLASILWSGKTASPGPDVPAQVTAMGFWPPEAPKVSYLLYLDGVTRDPRKKRGTLGRVLGIAKQAEKIASSPYTSAPAWTAAAQKKSKNVQKAGVASRMPDFKGMTMREAFLRIQSLGLAATLKGEGRVTAQVPKPGTSLKDISECRIICGRNEKI